jgi:MoxR-like ATPase
VSFTSDLLPADLTGLNVFDQANLKFHFQPGPLFSQVLLADEINRASPAPRVPCLRRWRRAG